jgi:prepilin-type N-terminal cleavage/methylation domain-containing protein
MIRKRQQAGFTLLEAIIVIAIIGVVTGIGSVMFFTMMDVWNDLKAQTDIDSVAERVLDSIGEDLTGVVSPKLAGRTLVGTDGAVEDDAYRRIPLDNDQIEFPALGLTHDRAQGSTREVGALVQYHVDRARKNTLIRTATSLAPNSLSNEQPVAAGVLQLGFEYAGPDNPEWQPAWTGESGLPGAVRVTLTLVDPERPLGAQVCRKAVYKIHVE